MNRWIIVLSVCVLLSCGRTAQKTEEDGKAKAEMTAGQTQPEQQVFPMPEVPGMITSAEEARTYLVAHFWDEFDFQDVRLLRSKPVLAQGLANFVSLSAANVMEQKDAVDRGFGTLCKGITENRSLTDSLKYYVEEYLYNPNSPYYNEELYAVYLRCMLQTSIDEARKSTFQFLLSLINRNNPGEIATDFPYYLPNGKSQTLRSTLVSGNYLLLIFYDPECQNCHQIMQQMIQNRYLNSLSENGLLTVLAVYTEGNKDVWKQSLQEMPDSWIVGEDRQTIKDNALYDLKAMPSMYLLNKKKEVLLKDASYAQLMQVLQ